LLDEQTENVGNTKPHKIRSNVDKYEGYGSITKKQGEIVNYNEPNAKGASRFFYCAKASKSERGKNNKHPTVKPIKFFEWLIRLVTREGQVVLDPFLGSGTTAIASFRVGRKYIGIEREKEYIEIAEERLAQEAL